MTKILWTLQWKELEEYLAIIPGARIGSDLIAHEVERWMGYWLIGHEGERNNCLSKI